MRFDKIQFSGVLSSKFQKRNTPVYVGVANL